MYCRETRVRCLDAKHKLGKFPGTLLLCIPDHNHLAFCEYVMSNLERHEGSYGPRRPSVTLFQLRHNSVTSQTAGKFFLGVRRAER